MFTLDAELAILITKKQIRKDSIMNGNKTKNTDIEQNIVQRAKMIFTNLKKLLRTNTIKVKYFRSCKCYLINASVS